MPETSANASCDRPVAFRASFTLRPNVCGSSIGHYQQIAVFKHHPI